MGEIIRTPILINSHAVALIHIFTRTDHLEDMWTGDVETLIEEKLGIPKNAAKQFVKQLEDQWSPAFMMALRDEITEKLKEHDRDYGTEFVLNKIRWDN